MHIGMSAGLSLINQTVKSMYNSGVLCLCSTLCALALPH